MEVKQHRAAGIVVRIVAEAEQEAKQAADAEMNIVGAAAAADTTFIRDVTIDRIGAMALAVHLRARRGATGNTTLVSRRSKMVYDLLGVLRAGPQEKRVSDSHHPGSQKSSVEGKTEWGRGCES